MKGYEVLLLLYTQTETWREIKIPKNITLRQLHSLIQKIFGFDDYHQWEFKVPAQIPEKDAVNLNDIVEYISSEEAENILLEELFDENDVLLYEYDFGDSWEIVVHKKSDVDYDYKTALLTDYAGKYNPMDDLGGLMVFEELMEALDDDEELGYVLEEYELSRGALSKMDFEKKYKVGSRIRIN